MGAEGKQTSPKARDDGRGEKETRTHYISSRRIPVFPISNRNTNMLVITVFPSSQGTETPAIPVFLNYASSRNTKTGNSSIVQKPNYKNVGNSTAPRF